MWMGGWKGGSRAFQWHVWEPMGTVMYGRVISARTNDRGVCYGARQSDYVFDERTGDYEGAVLPFIAVIF